MKITIYYFSSTGNSLYAAKKLQEGLENCEIISMVKALKEDKLSCNSDAIGFIYPLHCFGLPPVVGEFISKAELNKNAYLFALQTTGGGSSKNAFAMINDILKKKNMSLSNIEEVKYISNYIRMGRSATQERALEAIEKNENKILSFIKSIKYRRVISNNINKNKVTNILYKLWKEEFIIKDKNFNVNNDCIGCGLCQKICPVQNISLSNSKPKWHGKCVDCMGCINICPKKAINIGNKTIKKNRYRNPYIKVEELI